MFGTAKRKVHIWSAIISSVVLFSGCNSPLSEQDSTEKAAHVFRGNTQGTTYEIIIADESVNFSGEEIDSLLAAFDASLSTYIPSSKISQLNAGGKNTQVVDSSGFFKTCYLKSREIFDLTDGAFDPSVFPLVKGWGFMDNLESPLSQVEVDSILDFIGLDGNHIINFSDKRIELAKSKQAFQLDFNAIAQGYSVDVLANFLRDRGQENFYVEIGGELYLEGKNRDGVDWRIGIDTPIDRSSSHDVESIVSISDAAVATSGSYRKFYEKDGQRYAHFLDPKTGYPVQHSLLSATVIAPTCAEADAFATAFMVMGTERTVEFIETHPELKVEVYLLESDPEEEYKRTMSPGFASYLAKE